jgi:uncharacterized membrane protein YbhN (UPF0104 family)
MTDTPGARAGSGRSDDRAETQHLEATHDHLTEAIAAPRDPVADDADGHPTTRLNPGGKDVDTRATDLTDTSILSAPTTIEGSTDPARAPAHQPVAADTSDGHMSAADAAEIASVVRAASTATSEVGTLVTGAGASSDNQINSRDESSAARSPAPGSQPTAYLPGSGTIVIEDGVIPKRVRRPFDLVRTLTAVAAIAAIVGVTYFLTATSSGVQLDISKAGAQLPDPLRTVISIAAAVGALGLPAAIAVSLLLRRRPRQLLDAVIALVLGLVVSYGIAWVVQTYGSAQLLVALTGQSSRNDRLALDAAIVGLTAFVTVARTVGQTRFGPFAVVALAAVAVAPVVSLSASVVTIGISLLLGWAIGLLMRYLVGTPTTRPSGWEVASTMDAAGFPLTILKASRETARGRSYRATTVNGHRMRVKVLDRDREGAGLLSSGWRKLRLHEDTSDSSGFSMRSALEHAALLSYAAQAGGTPTPRLELVSAVGPDSALLAYEHVEGVTLAEVGPDEITDIDLQNAFRTVRELHNDNLAHRSLSAEQLLRDPHGKVWLAGIDHGVIAASDTQMRIDLAELICTLGLLAGADRTIAAGTVVMGSARMARALPAMQLVAMSTSTRRNMRGQKKLLVALRDGLAANTPQGEVETLEFRRIRPRTLFTLVAGVVAGYLLVGQLTTYNVLSLFGTARWGWVAAAAVLSFVSFIGAALSLSGFVPERLSNLRTFAAQLAAGFATLVSPPTVGAVAVNVRYLQKSGLHPALASASVGVSQVFAFFLHITLLFGFGLAAGRQQEFKIEAPAWALWSLLILVVLAATSFAFGPVRRIVSERVKPILTEVGPRLLTLAQRPWKIIEGIGGILLLNGAFCLCMVASVHAFGGGGNFAAIAIVYLAGSTLGQASPTPGGIGAVEAVYIAGLTAAGIDPGVALSATFLFRLLTFYLPTIPGYLCFNWLQRVGSL